MENFKEFANKREPYLLDHIEFAVPDGFMNRLYKTIDAYAALAVRTAEKERQKREATVEQFVKKEPETPVDRTRSTGANNAYGFDDSIKL